MILLAQTGIVVSASRDLEPVKCCETSVVMMMSDLWYVVETILTSISYKTFLCVHLPPRKGMTFQCLKTTSGTDNR